jgi:TolB-like protein/DNA-binding winged helix-turn-helix (wHTH) protein/tetratricopeptide (TPR) repeat protein
VHQAPTTVKIVRFSGFEVDLRNRDVRLNGAPVAIQDKPLELLLALLEWPGDLVSREELRNRLWPTDAFGVFEDGLNTAVRKLRIALNDSTETPRYIETVPKRGYRFIGQIEIDPPEAGIAAASRAPASIGSRRLRLALWSALAVGFAGAVFGALHMRQISAANRNLRSIAVLPFENLSGDPKQEYFADAMTDEMTSDLAKIGALRVISRTSSMHFKGTTQTVPQIAQALNVDAVIEGSVLRTGDRVRITVQMINAHTDSHIWSDSYERGMQDVLAMQNEVAHTIAAQVRAVITPAEEGRLRPESVNPAAYDDYLLGIYFVRKRTPEAIEKAIEQFHSAIGKDPKFARAYAGLAQAYFEKEIWAGIGIGKSEAEIRAATQKALELDSNLAEGHTLMGRIHYQYDWDWDGADEEYQRSIALNAGIPETHALYAYFLQSMGRQEEAISEAHSAVELDPISPSSLSDEGRILYRARQYEKAIAVYRRALEIDPAFLPAVGRIIEAYDEAGKFDDALRYTRQLQRQVSDRRLVLPYFALIYAHMGRRSDATQILKEIEAVRSPSRNRVVMISIYAALGDRDRAITLLERAIKERSTLPFILVDPQMDPLRSDPRFTELLHRVGLG